MLAAWVRFCKGTDPIHDPVSFLRARMSTWEFWRGTDGNMGNMQAAGLAHGEVGGGGGRTG